MCNLSVIRHHNKMYIYKWRQIVLINYLYNKGIHTYWKLRSDKVIHEIIHT